MKKIIAALLLICSSVVLAGHQVMLIKRTDANVTGITFWWEAENSLTLDVSNDYTAGDNIAVDSPVGGPTFSTDASKLGLGSYGIHVNASSEHMEFSQNPDATPPNNYPADSIVSGTAGRFGCWVRYTVPEGETENTHYPGTSGTGANNGAIILGGRKATGEPYIRLQFRGQSTRGFQLAIYDGTAITYIDTPSNGIAGNVWYFVEAAWKLDNGAGADILRLYIDGDLITENTSATITEFILNGTTSWRIGDWSGIASISKDYYIDHILVSSDYTKNLFQLATTANYP